MKTKYIIHLLLPVLTMLLLVSCGDDEELIIDNTLRVLTQTIDGENVTEDLAAVSNTPITTLLFSHQLNKASIESAVTLNGSNGEVPVSFSYGVSDSELSIAPNMELAYDAEYELSISAGAHGSNGENLNVPFVLLFRTAPFIPANVTLTSDVSSISEDAGISIIKAELSEVVSEVVTITLNFEGSATSGADYESSATVLTINSGETVANLEIAATQDSDIEGTENIRVSIAVIENAEELDPQVVEIDILDDDIDSNGDGFPDRGFIINEVLFDPPSGDPGDANGDGTRSPSEDEFIEFVNDSDQEVDLSGYTLFDATNLETMEPRHVFPEGTIIPPQGVYVLFGGGTPSADFGNAQVAVSTTGNMNLSNSDDVITILDTDGNVFITFDTQVEGSGVGFGEDQSVTRFEDINGDFTLHTMANPALLYSPGKKVDGSNFDGSTTNNGVGFIINEVLFDPPSGDPGDANGDGTRSASEDEFIEFVNDSDQEVDLSGYTLFDATNLETMEPRHVFPEGTIIPPQGVYVLFGGGTPFGTFGDAQVAVSSTGNMNLSNADDVITILDTDGNVFITFDTQVEGSGVGFGEDQSVTRNPDITGPFVLQQDVDPTFLYTPGTRNDGSPF